MSIDLKTVFHTSELSRLDLTYGLKPEEAQLALTKLADEMAKIVNFIGILAEVDTTGVEPFVSPMLEVPGYRDDVPIQSPVTQDFLEQAPDRVGDFFAVPKII